MDELLPARTVVSLRVRLGQLTRWDFHPLDCGLVGRYPDPDLRFSRIRFLGRTRFRAEFHSYPLKIPVAIPRSEVCLCISDTA